MNLALQLSAILLVVCRDYSILLRSEDLQRDIPTKKKEFTTCLLDTTFHSYIWINHMLSLTCYYLLQTTEKAPKFIFFIKYSVAK